MASSRWKRFAFFERQSMTIPDVIVNDLQISETTPATTANANNPSPRTPLNFCVTTAALPLHTKPPLTTTTSTTEPPPPPHPSAQNSVAAMWSSLHACHPTTMDHNTSGIISSSNNINNNSSSKTDRPKAIQLPSQGQAAFAPSSAVVSTTLLDGLVLGFVSSRQSARIHCFDVTVRCNPSSSSSAATEELDGWRGYWTPFPPKLPPPTGQPSTNITTTTTTMGNDVTLSSSMVVAIATCRVTFTKVRAHSPLHVACLGIQNQLVVYEDPHLSLSCRLPVHDTVHDTTNSAAESMIMYTVPSGSKWNTSNDGEACVLNMVPGMVAVGTTTGVVVVYAYHTSVTTTTNPTTVGIATKNKQLSRMLRPYLRIPPPPVSDVGVVSVQLSISSNQQKANIYVSYNRATRTTSPTSVSSNTSTAGICCYDLPLPPNNLSTLSSSLAAPLSRHDLDGRYVSSNNLVDSYIRRQGGRILTVVRLFVLL